MFFVGFEKSTTIAGQIERSAPSPYMSSRRVGWGSARWLVACARVGAGSVGPAWRGSPPSTSVNKIDGALSSEGATGAQSAPFLPPSPRFAHAGPRGAGRRSRDCGLRGTPSSKRETKNACARCGAASGAQHERRCTQSSSAAAKTTEVCGNPVSVVRTTETLSGQQHLFCLCEVRPITHNRRPVGGIRQRLFCLTFCGISCSFSSSLRSMIAASRS